MPIFDRVKGASGAYGVILAGAASLTIVLEGWAFLQKDRLVIDQALLVFFLLVPLLTALGLWILHRTGTPGTPANLWRWPLRWAGVTLAAFIVVIVTHMAWTSVFPVRAVAAGPVSVSRADIYNYRHFGYSFYMRGKERRVAAGERALDEMLTDLNGNEVALSGLWERRPIVVEFGSVTCPVFCGKVPAMESLARQYSGRVDFYVVYVREAHPGQNYPAHQSFKQKLEHARTLRRLEGISRQILVDDLGGAMNRNYGAMPNSVYVIGRDGVIAYRADWNDIGQVERQLHAVLDNDGYAAGVRPASVQDNFVKVNTGAVGGTLRVLRRAGFAAVADFVISFPTMSMGRLRAGAQPRN